MISALILMHVAGASGTPALAQDVPVLVPVPSAQPLAAEKKWAVCIGAGDYTGLTPLRYSTADAEAFSQTLKAGYGFDASTVELISDAPGVKLRPTSATILGALDRLIGDRRLDRGDLFVFYFSGHGIGTAKGDYLIPTDVAEKDAETRAVPVRAVVERFVRAGLKNVLIIADACRSGKENPFGKELQELGRKANIAVLLGCQPGQRSYEYPRLKKGVFTHFLVRAMEDRALTDPTSGALWASAVAKQTAAQVRAYTEIDYGEDAQTPVAWTEPSQDVLLAAYPPQGEEAVGALKSIGVEFKEGRLDAPRYGRYLSAMGSELKRLNRMPEAITTLKTLDGLGLATWGDLLGLATALNAENRDNEVGSLVARAVREPVPSDQSEYTILLGHPEYVGVERYRRALAFVADPKVYGFFGAQTLVAASRGRLRASEAQIARDLAPYVPFFPVDSVEGHYLAAHIALGEAKWERAIALAEAGAKSDDASVRDYLRLVRQKAAESLKDDAKIDAVIAEGEADPEATFPWTSERLERMQARKDPGFATEVIRIATTTEFDRRLTELILLLGADAAELLPDAERLEKLHPYSWQAAVNTWLVSSAVTDFEGVPNLPETALKYAPDRVDLVRYALNRWDDLLEKARLADRVSGTTAARARGQLVDRYFEHWDEIKDAPVALMGVGRMLMRSGQATRGAFFARKFLWSYAQRAGYVRRELMATSLFLALNGMDEEIANEAFRALERDGGLAPRHIVRYAMHQALIGERGEFDRAVALWPKLERGEPDELVKGYFDFSRALFAARRHDEKEVKRLVEGRKALDRASGMLAYLAIFLSQTKPTLSQTLGDYLIKPDGEFTDLQVAATVAVVNEYSGRTTSDEILIRQGLSTYMAGYPGHPFVRPIGYDGALGQALFGGHTEWKGMFETGVIAEQAELTLDVDAEGAAKGTIRLPESKLAFEVAGDVDAMGNLTAEVATEGRPLFILAMKLPPTALVVQSLGWTDRNLGPFVATLLKKPETSAQLRLEVAAGRELAPKGTDRG